MGNILPQAAGFLLLPIYTRYLTPADYGVVSSMQALASILAVLFTLAIDRSIYRLFFDFKTDKEKKDYLGTISISLVTISALILSLLFAFSETISLMYKSIAFYPYYLYSIITTYLTVFSIIPKIYFQINEKAGKFVLISIVQFLTSTGFVFWFVVGEKSGAIGLLKGQLFGIIFVLPLYLYVTYRIINFTFKVQILKNSLMFSLPMVPGLLSAWVLNISNRVFIERYFDLHDVGIYSIGNKIAGLVLIITGAFRLAYSPLFYRLANSINQVEAKRKLYLYNNTYIVILFAITLTISVFSKEAMLLLLDQKYFEAYKLVSLISIAYLISQASSLFNLMIYQEKKVVSLMWIGLAGAGVNIIFNFFLISEMGAYGAAYSSILSFTLIFMLSLWQAKKCYFVQLNWRLLLPLFSLLILIIVFFRLVDINIYINLLIKVAVCAVIFTLLYKNYFIHLRSIFQGKL